MTLRAVVTDLLAAHASAGGFLDAPTMGAETDGAEAIDVAQLDGLERIGPYRIVRPLGEGGFGVVYLAEQQVPVRRQVAMKVIKLGMDTRQVIARFTQERQALAMMEHPGIAQVFDAGATETGRPYFVMEYVDGVAITDYCDAERMSVRDRLRLFREVCLAVRHAHQKGVIHRDIKPNNVLVSTIDARPAPKIIDFGIAKAATPDLGGATALTAGRQLIGTPEYMSPEQAATPERIDTRTDVYSLGVLLYRLLAGAGPYDAARLREASVVELAWLIQEEQPPRPSTRLRTGIMKLSEAAERRASDPARLHRELRGELDWIVMKAIEKDAGRRYQTVSEFAADIDRFLVDEPVSAGPPGAGYRVRKFMHRHGAAIATFALVLIAVLGGAVAAIVFGFREAEQRVRAERAHEDLQVITDFQTNMLGSMDARLLGRDLVSRLRASVRSGLEAQGLPEEEIEEAMARLAALHGLVNETDLARRLIDESILLRSRELVDREFRDRPGIEATLRSIIGNAYVSLGNYELSEPNLRAAIRLRTEVLGREHRDTIRAMLDLAHMYRLMRRDEAAFDIRESALAIAREHLPETDPVRWESMHVYALSLLPDRPEEATAIIDSVVARKLEHLGPGDVSTLRSQRALEGAYRVQKRYAAAHALIRSSLEHARTSLGEVHGETLQWMERLATLLNRMDHVEEAREQYARTVSASERGLGPGHPATANLMGNYATFLERRGHVDESAAIRMRILDRMTAEYGAEHPRTIIQASNVAGFHMRQGNVEQAAARWEAAYETAVRARGPTWSQALQLREYVGIAWERLGRHAEARDLFAALHDVRRRVNGDDDETTIRAARAVSRLERKAALDAAD